MSKKNLTKENYLERVPLKNDNIGWSSDEEGIVTLEIENKGLFKFLTQKLLKKPRISYIHLDEMGSFVWPLIDGEKTILSIGEAVSAHFGDKAEPLYDRLSQYFKILESYDFIKWNK